MSLEQSIVIIPAYNEEASVGEVVSALRAKYPCDVVVVNDASSDDTEHAARAAGAGIINLMTRLGSWGATQTGIRYALARNYQRVITIDADGQHHPETVHTLVEQSVRGNADVVIGSCIGRATWARRVAWHVFRKLGRLSIRDLTSGLRVYSRRAMHVLVSRDATLLDYQDVGVLVLLRQNHLIIHEVDVDMSHRLSGGSRIFSSWGRVASYLAQTAVLCTAKLGYSRRVRISEPHD